MHARVAAGQGAAAHFFIWIPVDDAGGVCIGFSLRQFFLVLLLLLLLSLSIPIIERFKKHGSLGREGGEQGFNPLHTLTTCVRISYVRLQKRPVAGGIGIDPCSSSSSSRRCDTCAGPTTAVASMTAMAFEASSS